MKIWYLPSCVQYNLHACVYHNVIACVVIFQYWNMGVIPPQYKVIETASEASKRT